MRLWTIHPKYLDPAGLVALWREGLLARAVLRGRTKGYRHHPQLCRFRAAASPIGAINAYLAAVLAEAEARGYSFDRSNIRGPRGKDRLPAASGQLAYEWARLMKKLRARNTAAWRLARAVKKPEPHPLFAVGPGPVADWEKVKRPGKSRKAKVRPAL